jgi:hypothetical protein
VKHKRDGQAVGHGLGKIQARTLGKARRLKGVTKAAPEGKRLLGGGYSVRRKFERWLRGQEAA